MNMFGFDNSYSRLPKSFFAPATPEKVSSPALIAFNRELAEELGLTVVGFLRDHGFNVYSQAYRIV